MIFMTSKILTPHLFCLNKLINFCRFGNFIGEAEESEDESQHGVDAGAYVYDDEPEEAPEATGQELMEIDGWWAKK
jgi:hypothetical protein